MKGYLERQYAQARRRVGVNGWREDAGRINQGGTAGFPVPLQGQEPGVFGITEKFAGKAWYITL